MLENEIIVRRWLQSFATDVPKEIMKEHVTKSGNFLWHIFGWGLTSYLQGDEARKTLDALSSKEKCFLFHNGYSLSGKNNIEDISSCPKLSSVQMDELQEKQNFSKKDMYLVEQNFNWTYVITHESDCGPYFCYRTN